MTNNLQKHADLVDKICLANGYLEWVAALNDAIMLAAANNAHLDTIRDLADISNFLIGIGVSDIDAEAELEKIKGVAA